MFTPVKSLRVYEQVIQQVRDMIIDGTLKKGDKLPTERELAMQLGVSRSSVREALRALEVIGLVESRQGGGNFIKQSFEDSLFEPLSMMFMLEESKPSDILELRRIIEVENAVLAARKISPEQLNEIRAILNNMKSNNDEETNADLDRNFHYHISKASGNILVISVLNVISTLMDTFIKDARVSILSDSENLSLLNSIHEEIYKNLAAKDADGAGNAMRKHFDLIEKYLKD